MKRIVAFIIAMSCIFSALSVTSAQQSDDTDIALRVAAGLGILEYISPEDTISRGDFALYMYNMLFKETLGEQSGWEDNFFGDFFMDDELIGDEGDSKEISLFWDVTSESEYYDAIMYGVRIGIFEGVGRGSFKPGENVTVIQVLKTLLTLMGYKNYAEAEGGYPTGYLSLAESMGLLKGVENGAYDDASAADAARMIYNCFDKYCFEIESFTPDGITLAPDSSKTFLNKFLKLDYIEDIVADNGIYAIDGESDIPKGSVKIGDKILFASKEQLKQMREDTAKQVIAYYSIDEETEDELVFAAVKKDESIIISPQDFYDYTLSKISYYDANRTRSVNLEPGTGMIYNGEYKPSFSKEDFMFDRGSIRIAKTEKNGGYDCIIIESYSSWYIKSIDYDKYTIYNGTNDSSSETDDALLELEEIISEGEADITDSSGETIEFGDMLMFGAIDFYKTGSRYVKIYYSDKRVEPFVVNSVDEDDFFRSIISSGEEEYAVASEFSNSANGIVIGLKDELALVLNSFGEVIWAENLADSYYDLTVSYNIGITADDDMEKYFLKLINEKGTVKKYEIDEKVIFGSRLDLKREDYVRMTPEKLYEEIKNHVGIIAVNINAQDKITMVELPYYTRAGEKRLQVIYDNTQMSESSLPQSRRDSRLCVITEQVWLNPKSIVWQAPKNTDYIKDSTKYVVHDMSVFPSQGQTKGSIIAYGINAGSVYAKWVDYKRDIGKSISYEDTSYFIVTDVKTGLTQDDEATVILDGYRCWHDKDMAAATIYAVDGAGETNSGELCNPALKATSFYDIYSEDNVKYYAVEKGDIIKYTYNTDIQYPTKIAILYRASEGKILESSGEYSTNYRTEKTNPFGLNYACTRAPYDPAGYSADRKFTLGFVYSIRDDIAVVTTQNLRENSYDPGSGDMGEYKRFLSVNYPVNGFRGYEIEYSGKEVKVTQNTGWAEKLKSYIDYGGHCSKILTVHSGQMPSISFMITED